MKSKVFHLGKWNFGFIFEKFPKSYKRVNKYYRTGFHYFLDKQYVSSFFIVLYCARISFFLENMQNVGRNGAGSGA